MDNEIVEMEALSCDTCGYQATKETILGKGRNWCHFYEKYLKENLICPYFIN